ncbi:MAG: cytochrome P450 [Pseudomonadota bacterium]
MSHRNLHDPFREAREETGVLESDFVGENVPMILRYDELQTAARDFETFSSDAPFRVPVPAEDAVRPVRQLPIETDPPQHTDYRIIVQPFFSRPRSPEMAAEIAPVVAAALDAVIDAGPTEMALDFALPLQSRALTVLLRMPMEAAEEWISWGRHVFHGDDLPSDQKGGVLHAYLERQFDRVEAEARSESGPGDDLFSALARAEYRGRRLNRDEMIGFANLAFAGGRDTVINLVAFTLVHFAEHPEDFERLRNGDERLIRSTIEEFVRVASPLTFIGRVCPHGANVNGAEVPPDHRVGLCWASANRDATVFEAPDEVRIDRKPNRHLGFGWGAHTCLGAFHARLVLRTLIAQLCERVARLEIHDAEPAWEDWPAYRRQNGYESLIMTLHGR